MSEKVKIKTGDGVEIAGSHWRGEKGSPAVLLLHMMPATKESWADFGEKLYAAGFGALAIDLRGHGESDGGPDGWRDFSDKEHQKSIEDVRAGIQFQKDEGHSKFFLAGASIGANLALWHLAESERVAAAILLSAGLNYRGIETLPLVAKIRPEQGAFFVAAKDDKRSGGNASQMTEELYNASSGKKELKIYDTGGHGTDLLKAHSELTDELINWLKNF